MINEQMIHQFYIKLRQEGFTTIISVPCSMLSAICSDEFIPNDFKHIIATNEGEAVAIASGVHLAGKRAIIFCQNSGLGNMINPLTSLASIFKIPIFIIMSWRGHHERQDPEQHHLMGKITTDMLSLIDMHVSDIGSADLLSILPDVLLRLDRGLMCCILVKDKIGASINSKMELTRMTFPGQQYLNHYSDELLTRNKMSAVKALEQSVKAFGDNAIFVASTGIISKLLFTNNDRRNNFYMVGSMGYASAISFGIAISCSNTVITFDGDGALLMHLGNMATIGRYAPSNFVHILLNNGVHLTTGGQQNASATTNFSTLAAGCSYKSAKSIDSDITSEIEMLQSMSGPHFVDIRVNTDIPAGLQRPKISPQNNALRLRAFIE